MPSVRTRSKMRDIELSPVHQWKGAEQRSYNTKSGRLSFQIVGQPDRFVGALGYCRRDVLPRVHVFGCHERDAQKLVSSKAAAAFSAGKVARARALPFHARRFSAWATEPGDDLDNIWSPDRERRQQARSTRSFSPQT